MRNSASTPKRNSVQDESVSKAEKSSVKKLRQARLPFKVIPTGSPSVSSKTITTLISDKDEDAVKDASSTDSRKRKLSYDADDDGANNVIEEDRNISKENVQVLKAAAKKKKLSAVSNNDTTTDVVSLLDDGESETEDSKDTANVSIVSAAADKKDLDTKTSKSSVKDKRKGAGTPQTSSSQKDRGGSATKLQIKLPLSAGKKKRRKSNHNQTSNSSVAENTSNRLAQELTSDDIEEIATEHNPQKRKKLTETTKTKCTVVAEKQKEVETYDLDSESEQEDKTTEAVIEKNDKTKTISHANEKVEQSQQEASAKSGSEKPSSHSKSNTMVLGKNSNNDDVVENIEISNSSDENEDEKDDKVDLDEIVPSDNEADDETDNLVSKSINISSDTKSNNATKRVNNKKNSASASKNLTPKQVKLMEQRRKAREEKERKLQEEKMKKQQEKEEKEMAKKREREEKEEVKRKEREEKEEQKRKEREEKDRKRLADIEAKNEEKRKKQEAKEDELRKKEEDRKRKEQEKEEAELKKKKAAQAFTRFFVAKAPNNVQFKNEDDSNTGDGTKSLAFRPFQIKGDMKLAPIFRKNFTAEGKARLDDIVGYKNKTNAEKSEDEADEIIMRCKPLPKSQLYLSELRSGKILPGKWRRPSTESKDDVILVDELERIGQEIVEDTPAYVREEMRVKFYKFHDNRRPPYYGTWRKKSAVVTPRKPFAQDKKFFDYEVDSDDEWEEEEPGESLEDGSDEDKEKESEDDDYEVDNEWFVPHGHLSDEELQNEDELGMGDDNTREAQKVKLQLLQQEFAQEMKKKTEKIKPRLIGCIWADINGNQPPECAKILWDTLEKKTMLFNDPPLIEEPEVDRSSETNSPSAASNANTEKMADKLKPISISDNMVKDLTRLVHGNNHSKNFLINEYIAYIEKTEESVKNGGLRGPLKSMVRDKIDEIAEWQAIDASASSVQEIEQANEETTNDKKKKKVKRRLCWVVKQEMLDKMDLSSLQLKNSWKYTLPPKFVKPEKDVGTATESISTSAEGKGNSAISQTSKLSKEKIKKRGNVSSSNETSTVAKSPDIATSKEKKRVPLLMSVARGQQISKPAKNKLISQFLKQKNNDSLKISAPATSARRSNAATSPTIEDDDVLILD